VVAAVVAARCVAVVGFDLKGNGVEEVASGWSNGAVNVRQAADGVMLFKVPLVDATAPVAGLSVCDYKFDSMNPGLQVKKHNKHNRMISPVFSMLLRRMIVPIG